MSTIPASAMPHAYAEEGVDLRDPHGGHVEEESDDAGLSTGLLIAGGAVLGYMLYRIIR